MSGHLRKPAIFHADDPRLVSVEPDDAQRSKAALAAMLDATAGLVAATPPAPGRRLRWGRLFWSALSGLVVLGLGLAIESFIEELFSHAPWLGALGLGLAMLAGLALAALIVREVIGLAGLARVEGLHERALAVIDSDDRSRGRALVADVISVTHRIPQLARARTRLTDLKADIIDGRDLVRLAERELMTPLDAEARRAIVTAAKRVSVVTAISPRAAIDMLFVLVNTLGLVRRLAVLYGVRPGPVGVLKLFRQVISHLAITGGVAVTDSLLQQLVGHGLAARLSVRLGEGMVNGLLTARLGLLAIELVRPLPFYALPRPALNDLAATLLRSSEAPAEASEVGGRTPPTGL